MKVTVIWGSLVAVPAIGVGVGVGGNGVGELVASCGDSDDSGASKVAIATYG